MDVHLLWLQPVVEKTARSIQRDSELVKRTFN